jgi:hypothetical protein
LKTQSAAPITSDARWRALAGAPASANLGTAANDATDEWRAASREIERAMDRKPVTRGVVRTRDV